MASLVILYGVLTVGLGFLIERIAPRLGNTTFVMDLAIGSICILLGTIGLAGHKRRVWIIFTLIVSAFVLLSRVISAWGGSGDRVSENTASPLLLTLMFLLTVIMLMYLFHGDRPPEFYNVPSEDQARKRGSEGVSADRGRNGR